MNATLNKKENTKKIEEFNIADIISDIKTNKFEVFFQPQIKHSDKDRLIGAEALVRWNHSKNAQLSPAYFVPILEKNGSIYELDKYVWNFVCQSIRGWLDNGIIPPTISVNVSRADILQKNFLKDFLSIVKANKVPFDRICIEITESSFIDDSKKLIETIKKLGDSGFIVAIDDFGSGYSSLSILESIPAKILKLDMNFFSSKENSARSQFIIGSVARMAKMIGMSVVAEGVEKTEQVEFLQSVGCDYFQGYLYSKPLNYLDFTNYIQNALTNDSLMKGDKIESDISEKSKNLQEIFNGIIFGTNNIIFVIETSTKKLLYANPSAESFYQKKFEPIKTTYFNEFCSKDFLVIDIDNLKMGESRETIFSINGQDLITKYFKIDWHGHNAVVFCQKKSLDSAVSSDM